MSERVVDDFVGRFALDPTSAANVEPTEARFVMSRQRLVVATDDDRIRVPLSSVVDVVVGRVPDDLEGVFDDTVIVRYRTGGETVRTLLLEGSGESMAKFATLVYGCLLDGTEVVVSHPTTVGGRVVAEPPTAAEVEVRPDAIAFRGDDASVSVDVSAVVDVDGSGRLPGIRDRPSLVVSHVGSDGVVSTAVSPPTDRVGTLIGRYLRREYGHARSQAASVTLEEPERQVLVAVYAGADVDLAAVLPEGAPPVTDVLETLRADGLVEEDCGVITPTDLGRVAVCQRFGTDGS